MISSNISLPNHYLLQVCQLVGDRGVPASDWLRQLGVSLDSNEESIVTLPWSLFQQLMLDAERFCGKGTLGLLLGERLLITTHGVVGYAALSSPSLREMVEVIARFIVLRIDLIAMETRLLGDDLWVGFYETRPLDTIRPMLFEAVVLAVRNILDFTTLGNSHIREVRFPFDGDQPLAESLFQCPVRYQQTDAGFLIPRAVIDQPQRMANNLSFKQTLAVCQDELAKLGAENDISGRVRRSLLQSRNGFPTLERMARRMNLTPRTLHRRLVSEGTSYRALLENTRELLATRYLESGQMSIKEIAFALGYADTAAFRKAFRRWKQASPSGYVINKQPTQT